MIRSWYVLCLCGGLSGCALLSPPQVIELPADMLSVEQFTIPSPQSSAELAALSPGSKVFLTHTTETHDLRITGEVLHASPEGVALMNVTRRAHTMQGTPVLSKVPYVSRLFKNTGVGAEQLPVLWVPNYLISSTQVLEPPPADYVAPQLAINTDDSPMFERIGIDFDFNVDETAPQRFEPPFMPAATTSNSTPF